MNPDGTTTLYRGTSRGGEVATNIGQSTTAPLAALPIRKQQADAFYIAVVSAAKNADTAAYSAGVRSNNSAYGAAPGTSLPGDNRPSADRSGGNTLPAPTVDKIGAGNPPGTKTAAPVDPLARWPVGSAARENVLAGANQVESLGTNFDNANVVAGQVRQQLSPYTTGAGSMLVKDLPGTVQK